MNDFTGATFVQILAAIGLFILAILLATPAKTAVCLSKEDARKLWPKQHLYWYSKDHCWSNRRGPPTNIRIDPPDAKRAMASERHYIYPLDTNGNMNGPFEDYCCWPSLDTLKALANGVEK